MEDPKKWARERLDDLLYAQWDICENNVPWADGTPEELAYWQSQLEDLDEEIRSLKRYLED